MGTSETWSGRIRALLYPVQFEKDPMDGLDHVFQMVIHKGALGAKPADYLGAVRQALASDVQLSNLLPQDQPESKIRSYLAEVECRLARELGAL